MTLALWRGDVLAEFAYEPVRAAALVARLEEARAATEEARVEALRLDDLSEALASLGRS
jgi:hypothetical protein